MFHLIAFLLIFISCGEKKVHRPDMGGVAGVEIKQTSLKENLKVDTEVLGPIKKNSENLKPNYSNSEGRKKVIGVSFGPGLYKVFGHLGALRILKKKNLKPHMVSGVGIGALVASLYSKEKSINSVEWKLFKIFEKIPRGLKPYTKKWKSKLFLALSEEFKGARIQDFDIPLFFPLRNKLTNKVEWVSRGKVIDYLLIALDFYPSKNLNYSSRGLPYVFNNFYFKKLGADMVVDIDILGSNIHFSKFSKNIRSKFVNFSTIISLDKKTSELFLQLKDNNIALDNFDTKEEVLKLKFEGEQEIIDKMLALSDDNFQNELDDRKN